MNKRILHRKTTVPLGENFKKIPKTSNKARSLRMALLGRHYTEHGDRLCRIVKKWSSSTSYCNVLFIPENYDFA